MQKTEENKMCIKPTEKCFCGSVMQSAKSVHFIQIVIYISWFSATKCLVALFAGIIRISPFSPR